MLGVCLLTEMIEIKKHLKKGVVFQLPLANVHFMRTRGGLKNKSDHMRGKKKTWVTIGALNVESCSRSPLASQLSVDLNNLVMPWPQK